MQLRTPRDLGLTIRERRRQLGLDQASLAQQAGVSRQWIIAVEKGKSGAQIGLLLRTLRVLGLEVSVLETDRRGPRSSHATTWIDLDAIIERTRGDQEES